MEKGRSLHLTVRPMLCLAQIGGLFPVEGALGRNSANIRFRRVSLLILYSSFVGLLCLTSFLHNLWSLAKYLKSDISLSAPIYVSLLKVGGPVVIVMPLCIHISKQWPSFVRRWEQIEDSVPELRVTNRTLWIIHLAPLSIILFILLFSAFTDYIEVFELHKCLKPAPFWDAFYLHSLTAYRMLFPDIPVPSWLKVLAVEFYKLINILHWAFCPTMSTIIPLIISSRLAVLNDMMVKHKTQLMGETYWKTVRESYNSLFQLTRLTDNLFTELIFFLCITETIFTVFLIYLALGLSWSPNKYVSVMIRLLFHTLVDLINFLSLLSVHEQSKKPLAVLMTVPSLQYNKDVARLYNQVVYEEMTFTGFNFFYITRSLVLTIISTIVTYEVLLIQFSKDTQQDTMEPSPRQYCLNIVPKYLALFNLNPGDITFDFTVTTNGTVSV